MLALLQAVTNSAGSSLIKDSAPTGNLKSLFGILGVNLAASAGTIGIQALANKALGKGAGAQFTPAAQSRIGAELTREPRERSSAASFFGGYGPAILVGGLGFVVVAGGFFYFRKRKG